MEENAYPVENTPVSSGGGGGEGGGSGEVNNVSNVNGSVPSVMMKRKRGRPKKLPFEAQSVTFISSNPQMGFPSPNSINPPLKRGRGRPKGSGKARLGSATVSPPPGFREGDIFGYGDEMKPHVLPIYPGEDVHGRILSFAHSGNRAITVISCTGPVTRVSICSPGSAGGMIYEGMFEILTLNGTFTYGGPEGSYHRRGTLTACLAKPNGEVFGGCVSGPIIAAGPIQLILGSFEQGRSSPTNIQFRSYPSPQLTNPTSAPPPPPLAPSDVHVPISKDTLPPSLNSKDDQESTPFLQVPPSSQPALNQQPQADTEEQVAEAYFADENPFGNNAP